MGRRKVRELVKNVRNHEVISGILNPKVYVGKKKTAVYNEFQKFLVNGEESSFSSILKVLLRYNEIKECTNYFLFKPETALANNYLDTDSLSVARLLDIFSVVLQENAEVMNAFLDVKKQVEHNILIGDCDKALDTLKGFRNSYGFSFWAVKIEFLCLAFKGDLAELNNRFNFYKSNNQSYMFQQLLKVYYWVAQSSDPTLTLNISVLRDINEFINGGALDMAALYSITSVQYPINRVTDPIHALHSCQLFNIFDLYVFSNQVLVEQYIDIKIANDKENLPFSQTIQEHLVLLENTLVSDVSVKFSQDIMKGIDENIDRVVKLYEAGKYKEIIDEYENSICFGHGSLCLSNILAKAYINQNVEPNSKVPDLQLTLIHKLIKIYSLSDSFQSIRELISLSHKVYLLNYSIEILLSIAIAVYEYFDTSTRLELFEFRKLSRLPCTPIAQYFKTSEVMYSTFSKDVELSEDRKIKLEILEKIKTKNAQNITSLLKSFSDNCLIKKDVIDLHCFYLLEFGYMDELLSYSSKCLIENENCLISFPKEVIREYITSNSIYNEYAVIFAFFYDRYNDTSNSDFVNEAFEEYIFGRGGNNPSAYINDLEQISPEELFIFLRVADTSSMEYLGVFDSTEELYFERLKIITSLLAKGIVEQEEIEKEFRETIDKIFISTNTAMISNSKIHIDVEGIYKSFSDELTTLIERYHSIEEDEETEYVQINADAGFESVVIKGRKNSILMRMVDGFQEKFVKELDESLSSEIRHGFFGNLLTSKLQERKILCELGEDSEYLSNQYWKDTYQIVNKTIVDDVDKTLRVFSENYNKIIEAAEAWINVGALLDENEAIFRIFVTKTGVEKLKLLVDSKVNSQSVFDFISMIQFESLDQCLNRIKKSLNEEFINDIDSLFMKLRTDLDIAKRGTPLTELIDSISLVQNEIKEDVRTVCEWFAVKSEVNYLPVPIQSIVQIAENCFRQSFYFREKIDIKINGNVLVESDLVYSLVLALINCFSNGVKHGSTDQPISVVVDTEKENSFSVIITNKITQQHWTELSSGRFESLLKNINLEEKSELLTSQGGSGLYKSKYYLNKASSKFSFHPTFSKSEFEVMINYV
jgi:hypothetical protein